MTSNTIQPIAVADPTVPDGAKVEGQKRKPPKGKKAISQSRYGLISGALPKRYRWAAMAVAKFRRLLEAAVIDAKGEVGLVDACHVSTCVRWERAALVAGRQLVDHDAELTPLERAKLAADVASASAKRDQSIKLLDLAASDRGWKWPTATDVIDEPPTDDQDTRTPSRGIPIDSEGN